MTYYMTILECVIIDKTSKQFELDTYILGQNHWNSIRLHEIINFPPSPINKVEF